MEYGTLVDIVIGRYCVLHDCVTMKYLVTTRPILVW